MTEKTKNSILLQNTRVILAKLGLDGHDIGIRVIASKLRDCGMEVIFLGLFQTEASVVNTAIQEDADLIGLSFHGNDHMELMPAVFDELKKNGADDIVVFGGGVIPQEDIPNLKKKGVQAVFTPGTPIKSVIDFIEEVRRHK